MTLYFKVIENKFSTPVNALKPVLLVLVCVRSRCVEYIEKIRVMLRGYCEISLHMVKHYFIWLHIQSVMNSYQETGIRYHDYTDVCI